MWYITMTRYSIKPNDWIFVKSYRFLFFANNISKNTAKEISLKLCSKYNQKRFCYAKQSATDALKIDPKKEQY